MTLRTLNYGHYGIFLIMGNAGFCPSTVVFLLELFPDTKPSWPESSNAAKLGFRV